MPQGIIFIPDMEVHNGKCLDSIKRIWEVQMTRKVPIKRDLGPTVGVCQEAHTTSIQNAHTGMVHWANIWDVKRPAKRGLASCQVVPHQEVNGSHIGS